MFCHKASVRPLRVASAEQMRPVCQPALSLRSKHQLSPAQAYTSAAPGQQATDAGQKNFFEAAVGAVLSLFDDEQAQQTSDELQLPPELRAYLEEMEAHGSGSHGGWVHSHIAERLASTSEDPSD